MDKEFQHLVKEDLFDLADHIESLPPNNFNINIWFWECGTPACVGGYACKMFPKTFEQVSDIQRDFIKLKGTSVCGYEALAWAFDTTIEEARYFADPANYEQACTWEDSSTKEFIEEVVKRIRLVAKDEYYEREGVGRSNELSEKVANTSN